MGQLTLRRIRDDGPGPAGEIRVFLGSDPPTGSDHDLRHLPVLAPTPWLVQNFGRDRGRFPTFRNRYLRLLRSKARTRHLEYLARLCRDRDIALLTMEPDPDRSPEAVVLEALVRRFGCRRG